MKLQYSNMPQITYIDTGKHRERERPTLCPRLLRGVIRYRVPILIFMAFFRLIGLSFSEMQQWDESVYALRVQVLLQYGDMWDQSPHMLSGLRYATQPPLFVWLSAASVLLFHDALWAYRLPAALAGALLVLLLYRFAREHLPPGHALAVAGLFAFSPLPVFFSRQAQPETVIALCLLAALWLVLRAIRLRRRIFAVPAGLALGAALLTKSAVALVLPVSVVIAAVFLSPAARRRTWTAAVLMTLVSLPVWLPWAWMMTDAHGKGDALWMFAAAVSSGGGWSGLDGLLRESGGMRLSHPATMQLLILLPFAAVFIWNALVINRRVQWVLVAVTLVCSVAVLWLLQLRIEILLIPILPLLCFAAVQGAVSARALGQQRSSRRLRGLLSLPVLFGVTLCFAVLSM
ncbi:MAG: glycosyltransferase family 39 protein, partial [Bacteroidetes bacterium]|nr:glycosyltransferase family 39 protein [Bacteroidota bacterium]